MEIVVDAKVTGSPEGSPQQSTRGERAGYTTRKLTSGGSRRGWVNPATCLANRTTVLHPFTLSALALLLHHFSHLSPAFLYLALLPSSSYPCARYHSLYQRTYVHVHTRTRPPIIPAALGLHSYSYSYSHSHSHPCSLLSCSSSRRCPPALRSVWNTILLLSDKETVVDSLERRDRFAIGVDRTDEQDSSFTVTCLCTFSLWFLHELSFLLLVYSFHFDSKG